MWPMIKRVFLFMTVNILVLLTLSLAWSFASRALGLPPGSYNYLLGFSVIFGFGGAFISLLMSKFVAKMAMGVQIIEPDTADPSLRFLLEKVHELARAARLPKMPEVGIYESPEVNAFATGPSKSNSLVAVSTGLLHRMDRTQAEGVLAHEISHIANGDMVTMTLIQGVINAIVLFLARVVANIVASQLRSDQDSYMLRWGLIMAFEILFSLFGLIVVNAFSRHREFRADSGGAKLAGREKMISALRGLKGYVDMVDERQQAIQSLKISGKQKSFLLTIFATHPPLDERIRRLETGQFR